MWNEGGGGWKRVGGGGGGGVGGKEKEGFVKVATSFFKTEHLLKLQRESNAEEIKFSCARSIII